MVILTSPYITQLALIICFSSLLPPSLLPFSLFKSLDDGKTSFAAQSILKLSFYLPQNALDSVVQIISLRLSKSFSVSVTFTDRCYQITQ